VNKLSFEQMAILVGIGDREAEVRALPPAARYWRERYVEVWGAHWHATDREDTPSRRASVSRSLRRLERRGLVHRSNDVTAGKGCRWRTTHVSLTEAGKAVYQELKQAPGWARTAQPTTG
jgi:hypothetical protein